MNASTFMRPLTEDETPGEVEFHFTNDLYVRQISIPKRHSLIPQHAHVWDHLTFVARGQVAVTKDNVLDRVYTAPAGIEIKAGVKHSFLTLEDNTVLLCIHSLHGEKQVAVLAEHNIFPGDG